MKFLNKNFDELEIFAQSKKDEYIGGFPFPHIVIDNFFNDFILNNILNEFPNNLDNIGYQYKTKVEQKKFTLNDSKLLSENINNFLNFLNSQIFLNFLQTLTGINEKLQSDPYLEGGGLHELKNDGFLNIHADFNLHPTLKLDRRLNILIYLNKDWEDSFGGNLQLWDKDMFKCEKKIIPIFNPMVIFLLQIFPIMEILIRLIAPKIKVESQLQCIIIQTGDLHTNENLVIIQQFLEKDLVQATLMVMLNLKNYLEKFIIEINKK